MPGGIRGDRQNTANGTYTSFRYGPDRQRYREAVLSGGIDVRVTTVLGSLYERIEEGTTVTHKHHILAGGKVVAIHTRDSGSNVSTHYLHRDHLGSVDAVTDELGAATYMSFNTFGERRNAETWVGPPAPPQDVDALRDITTHGYTGHQMLDEAELIHMGGRVYDPLLGRFLSPDPNVPEPGNSQSFNRYAYVYNNPLSYTDPSGFVPTARMIHGSAWQSAPAMAMSAGFSGMAWLGCDKACEARRAAQGLEPYNSEVSVDVSNGSDDSNEMSDGDGGGGGSGKIRNLTPEEMQKANTGLSEGIQEVEKTIDSLSGNSNRDLRLLARSLGYTSTKDRRFAAALEELKGNFQKIHALMVSAKESPGAVFMRKDMSGYGEYGKDGKIYLGNSFFSPTAGYATMVHEFAHKALGPHVDVSMNTGNAQSTLEGWAKIARTPWGDSAVGNQYRGWIINDAYTYSLITEGVWQ